MTDDMHDLLSAVDALTKPQRIVEWQDRDGERVIFKRTDPPLLEQLRTAIGSNIGGTGGGKQARERTPIDVGAFTKYEDIDGRIRSMLADLGATPGKGLTPEQVLRTWYTMWTATKREPHEHDEHIRILTRWAQEIRDKLSPPPSFDITSPCPICGQEWVVIGTNRDDHETIRALSAIERENMDQSQALCHACHKVWRGVGQMRELRIAIDDMDAEVETLARKLFEEHVPEKDHAAWWERVRSQWITHARKEVTAERAARHAGRENDSGGIHVA